MYSVLKSVTISNFQEVAEYDIKNLIDKVGKKSCELDPVPATIFQGCKKTLLPIITKITDEFLQSGCMPEKLKEAMLKPKLKKDSLECEEYTNCRRISNLKVLSKVSEKAVQNCAARLVTGSKKYALVMLRH